jgi:PAS domain S-box-containing protein
MAWNVFHKQQRDHHSANGAAADESATAHSDEFRDFLESIEAVAYVWDIAEHCFSYVSPQCEQILGFRPEALMQPGFWLSRIHSEDQTRFERALSAAAARGPLRTIEYRMLDPNGEEVWLRDQMRVSDRAAGGVVRGLVINISARKRIEAAIEASERRYRVMLEKIDVVPYSFDVQQNRYTYIGAQMGKLLRIGMQAGSFEGFRSKHVHNLDRERLSTEWRAACESNRSGELEYRVVASDGEVVWVRDVFHFETEPDGHATAYGNLVDITAKKRAEEALTESQMLMRAVIDAVPATISVKDLQGRYVLVNKAFADFHDKPLSWFDGGTAAELYSMAYMRSVEDREAEVIATGQRSAVYENERQHKDGHTTTWLASKAPLRDAAGQIKYVATVSIEITDRKKAERELQRSESKYRAIIEDQTEFLVRHRPDGTITFVNDAYCRYFGKTRDELLRTSFYDLVPANELDLLRTHLSLLSPESPVATIEQRDDSRSDGRVRFQHWTDRAFFDVSGQLIEYQSVGQDITERRLAEDMLQESERRFRHLVESTNIVPYTWDLESRRFTYVGPQAEKLLGYPASAWSGEGFWLSRIHPDDRSRALEGSRKLHDEKIGVQEEYRMLRADDTPVWVRDIVDVELQADDRYVAYGVMIDVTDTRRQTEALIQAQKMDIIGQMTGGVAHDFNNLLTVIIANLHMVMASAPADPPTQRRLSMISQAAERSSDLTKRLLAFSRRQTLLPKATDVNALVSGMTELLRRTLGETIEINLQLTPDLWTTHVDPGQLETALVNLAVNARDAMNNAGKLDIMTSNQILHGDPAKSEKPSGPFVMLAVSDTGCGMPPRILAKVFEPFFTTKEVGKGTGLGLSMIYGFVNQSGGWIDVESEVGKGTTFKIYLPRAKGEVADTEEKPSTETAVPQGNETVLCVDDDPQARMTVCELLAGLGYKVREAENGPSALMELHLNKDIDLLLTDIVMPGGMSGVVLASEAVRQLPHLGVLYTSGYAKGHFDEPGIWLPKPYSPGELARKVREALDARATLH